MRNKTVKTTPEVVEILKAGKVEGNAFYLPDIQLDRGLYVSVNKVLEALGAKWNRKLKAHVFDYDITEALSGILEGEDAIDWKKSTEFFWTPKEVTAMMIEQAIPFFYSSATMLEPSAGQGHIARAFASAVPSLEITCVEKNPMHMEKLDGLLCERFNEDFLEYAKNTDSKFDIVAMNPPFSEEMQHIQAAYGLLEDKHSILISIASAMVLNRNTKDGVAFREWFEGLNGVAIPLPENSFKETGTAVNTVMLVIEK